MRALKLLLIAFLALFLLPLAAHAAWWYSQEHTSSWSAADWTSAELLPPARLNPEAMVHIYSARVGRWRGIFAHHTWIVLKERGAPRYIRYDKVGWGRPVRQDGWAPDGRWFGHVPELIASVEGPAAEALIPRIREAVADYPFGIMNGYRAWPGPNSNSFVTHVLAAVPQLKAALPPTALGKDFRGEGAYAGLTPSHTGVQVSVAGLCGISVGWIEGIEINVLGLVAGLDVRRPALKLPGFGRIGMDVL